MLSHGNGCNKRATTMIPRTCKRQISWNFRFRRVTQCAWYIFVSNFIRFHFVNSEPSQLLSVCFKNTLVAVDEHNTEAVRPTIKPMTLNWANCIHVLGISPIISAKFSKVYQWVIQIESLQFYTDFFLFVQMFVATSPICIIEMPSLMFSLLHSKFMKAKPLLGQFTYHGFAMREVSVNSTSLYETN